jgi:hypothetical protein
MLKLKNSSRFYELFDKDYFLKLNNFCNTRFGYRKRMKNKDLLNIYALFEKNNNCSLFNGTNSLYYCKFLKCLFCYGTKISEKIIENGTEIIYINNYSKKLNGKFYSKTLSTHIHILLKICKDGKIPYKIINNEKHFENAIDLCKDGDCSICLEENKNKLCKIKKCGHIFHKECLYKWFSTNNSCPFCRCDIVVDNIILYYCIYE